MYILQSFCCRLYSSVTKYESNKKIDYTKTGYFPLVPEEAICCSFGLAVAIFFLPFSVSHFTFYLSHAIAENRKEKESLCRQWASCHFKIPFM